MARNVMKHTIHKWGDNILSIHEVIGPSHSSSRPKNEIIGLCLGKSFDHGLGIWQCQCLGFSLGHSLISDQGWISVVAAIVSLPQDDLCISTRRQRICVSHPYFQSAEEKKFRFVVLVGLCINLENKKEASRLCPAFLRHSGHASHAFVKIFKTYSSNIVLTKQKTNNLWCDDILMAKRKMPLNKEMEIVLPKSCLWNWEPGEIGIGSLTKVIATISPQIYWDLYNTFTLPSFR